MSLFGGGGMLDIMGQLPGIKSRMAEMKGKLEAMEIVEQSSDGLIQVKLNGTGIIHSLTIAPELLAPERQEELQNKQIQVLNLATEKVKKLAMEQLKEAAGPLAGMLGNIGM